MSETMVGKIGLCTAYCKGCRWRSVQYNSCDYFLFEGHGQRGCPVGDGCTRREIGRRGNVEVPVAHRPQVNTRAGADIAKALESNRARNAAASARRLELHAAGLTDAEIAAAEHVSIKSVQRWRQMAGLMANRKPREKSETPVSGAPKKPCVHQSPEVVARMERRMKLYLDGYSDAEIAAAEDSKAHAIAKWRNIRNLPPNRKIGRPRTVRREKAERDEKIMELYSQGHSDRQIALAVGLKATWTIGIWRKKRGLPPNCHTGNVSGQEAALRDARRMEMYQAGCSDVGIAKAEGLSASESIGRWRKRRGLPRNGRKKSVPD